MFDVFTFESVELNFVLLIPNYAGHALIDLEISVSVPAPSNRTVFSYCPLKKPHYGERM